MYLYVMILRVLMLAFAAIPLRELRIAQADVNFNNALSNILVSIGTIGYLVPKLLRNDEICETDDDCPMIMRCCQIDVKKYCCTPNNFVNIKPLLKHDHIG